MKNKKDLTQGSIFTTLIKLAIPIMATSFVQMFYNMTDMIWIGRIGSSSVAAVGSAGFYVWFCFSLIMLTKVGAEVGVAQSLGRKDIKGATSYAENAIQLSVLLALFYGIFIYTFSKQLIGFFGIEDSFVNFKAIGYLKIIAFGIPFTFLNPLYSGILNGSGNSKTPFYLNAMGLGLNMILDPLLIFGWWIFPKLGVKGAGIATVLSQFLVTTLFVLYFRFKKTGFLDFSIFKKPDFLILKKIFKLGFPVGLQSGLFTIFSMLIARIITRWGPLPIAIQKVGAQIEALSWMTASGFSSALSAFVGQNYGANKWDRIWKGYFIALSLVSIFGLIATILFIGFGKQVFSLFIPEAEAIKMGVVYLKILGLSQIFMCIEIVTAGAFNGLGKTTPPSLIGIIFTGARVPLALWLSSTFLDLTGVWWGMSISSFIKGVILFIYFIIILNNRPEISPKIYIKQMIYKWDCKYLRDKKAISGR